MIDRWHRRGEWILVKPFGGQWLHLPVGELKSAGVLGRVISSLGGAG